MAYPNLASPAASDPTLRPAFPLSAVAGMDRAKEALLLLAVDPGLKGVLISGPAGIGKSLLARAFSSLICSGNPLTPWVEVPLGVTAERLTGGLDLHRTLRTGRRVLADGLLAQANGGVLFLDEANLLPPSFARRIGGALKTGVVVVEADGVSGRFSTDFVLIGTCDPDEGEVDASLADPVGIHVTETGRLSHRERLELLNSLTGFQKDPLGFIASQEIEAARLKERIAAARGLLPEVTVAPEQRRLLTLVALRLGVEGHRADIFALRLARARAAFLGRRALEEGDLQAAVRLVLAPRARSGRRREDSRAGPAHNLEEAASGGPPNGAPPGNREADDLIFQAFDTDLPDGLLDPPEANGIRTNPRRSAGKRRHTETAALRRGRYVRAVAACAGRGKVAVDATLRAAAPLQLRRRLSRVDERQSPRILVDPDDLRWKQFRQPAGLVIIFVVDASGSMAHNRISQAKGAVLRLLQEAYRRRDKVALISFRGDRAETLLPPSRSVELASRALNHLAVGGGTPLSAGLCAALETARRSRRAGLGDPLIVLLSDGRPNVPAAARAGTPESGRPEAVWNELETVCGTLRAEGIPSVVIDTSHRHHRSADGERLAKMLGGRYVRLPLPNVEQICETVSGFAESLRSCLAPR